MAKRWREIKSQKYPLSKNNTDSSQWLKLKDFNLKKQLRLMYASERIKAFITDMFMINMPLLYLTTYVFLDGKNDFTHNQSAILACGVGYGLIISLFLAFTSQTPGFKYMGLKLMQKQNSSNPKVSMQNNTQDSNAASEIDLHFVKISLFKSIVRYVLWLIGTSFLIGLLFGLFRRDGRLLHDVLCGTYVLRA